MGIRAQGLAAHLVNEWRVSFSYRPAGSKFAAARSMYETILAEKPDVVYVLDMAVSGVSAALAARARRGGRVIIDTGDAITALARSAQLRGRAGIAATWLLEEAGLRGADRLVVRGSIHRELLAKRGLDSVWIPDGFEAELFYPAEASPTEVRPEVCLGLIGSVIWGGRIEATYGWDLVETLAALPDLPLRGLLVGDGTGLDPIRRHAESLGVAQRIQFAGRVPYRDLREWILRMDICLSTQTNDLPGNVRTTGKLPLYLACGKFILASHCGQAGLLLPENMLVEYEGSLDLRYPGKLAARIRDLWNIRSTWPSEGTTLAQKVAPHFEYSHLGAKLTRLLEEM